MNLRENCSNALERFVLSLFGTRSEIRSLGFERSPNATSIGLYTPLLSSLGLLAFTMKNPSPITSIGTAGMFTYMLWSLQSFSMSPTTIAGMRTNRSKEKVLNTLFERLKGCESQLPADEAVTEGVFSYYSPAEYSLFYFNDKEQSKLLESILRDVRIQNHGLPMVGAELEYASSLDRKMIVELNDLSIVIRPTIPGSYTTKEKSEIRTLPSKPYSFRWHLEEVFKRLPEDRTPQVSISVQDVNKERTPYILLALYFSSVSCVFPFVETKKDKDEIRDVKDSISFPGVYIGATTTTRRGLTLRGQTNYSVTQSKDPHEIADACFFASKLHAMNDKDFKKFAKEIEKVLGTGHHDFHWASKNMWDGENDKQYSPIIDAYLPSNGAYSLPERFIRENVETAKKHLGIKDAENHFPFYTDEEEEKIREVTCTMRAILEKHTVTTPEDIMYSTPLENLLRERVLV